MSFDALTISGAVAVLVSAGLVVGIVRNNDRRREERRSDDALSLDEQASRGEHAGR